MVRYSNLSWYIRAEIQSFLYVKEQRNLAKTNKMDHMLWHYNFNNLNAPYIDIIPGVTHIFFKIIDPYSGNIVILASGSNRDGQLGLGENIRTTVLERLRLNPLEFNLHEIIPGVDNTFIIFNSKYNNKQKIFSFGYNSYNCCGHYIDSYTVFAPLEIKTIPENYKVIKICPLFRTTYIWCKDEFEIDHLLVIGDNQYGQLGVGDLIAREKFEEVNIDFSQGIEDLLVFGFSVFLKCKKGLFFAGDNPFLRQELKMKSKCIFNRISIPIDRKLIKISVGDNHMLFLCKDIITNKREIFIRKLVVATQEGYFDEQIQFLKLDDVDFLGSEIIDVLSGSRFVVIITKNNLNNYGLTFLGDVINKGNDLQYTFLPEGTYNLNYKLCNDKLFISYLDNNNEQKIEVYTSGIFEQRLLINNTNLINLELLYEQTDYAEILKEKEFFEKINNGWEKTAEVIINGNKLLNTDVDVFQCAYRQHQSKVRDNYFNNYNIRNKADRFTLD